MRFDPSRLQFMAAAEILLAPNAAAVGLDIRVVGNDSGEKVRLAQRSTAQHGMAQHVARSLRACVRGGRRAARACMRLGRAARRCKP